LASPRALIVSCARRHGRRVGGERALAFPRGERFKVLGLVNEPGVKPQEAPLPPTDFAVKEQKKDKE
jgi:hypothetical protein